MIAFKEKDLDSPVHKVMKGREDTDISFGHDIAVFVPEIPDVTKKVQSLGVFRERAEEVRETPLPAGRIADLKA